jgi:hypothetical protein
MSILPNDNLSSQIGPEKVKKSKIRRILFKSYKPQPSIKTAIIVLAFLGVVFIVIGAVLVYYGNQIREFRGKVEWKEKKSIQNVDVDVDKEMKKPVFVYYEISNYFQNRRKYLQSISYKQLKGNEISRVEADKQCHHADIKQLLIKRYQESKINIPEDKDDEVAVPCGIVAKSYPNIIITSKDYEIVDENISWDYEKEHRFKNNDKKVNWTDIENGKN